MSYTLPKCRQTYIHKVRYSHEENTPCVNSSFGSCYGISINIYEIKISQLTFLIARISVAMINTTQMHEDDYLLP